MLAATFFDGGEWSRGIAVTLSEGISVAWSPRPFVDGSGQAVRTFVPLTLENGVGTWRTRWKAGLVTIRADWRGDRAVLQPAVQAVAEEGATGGASALVPELAPACANDVSYVHLSQAGLTNAWSESAVRRSEVTKVRLIWCGRVGTERAALTGVSTSDGTDFQVLTEQVSRATGLAMAHGTSSEVWPVPPGRGADYPMARELAVDAAHRQAGHTVTVVAAGGVLVQLEDADGPFAAGKRKLTADGLARFVLRGRDAGRWSGGHPVDVVVLDVHEQEVDRMRARVADPWAKEIDGPEATTDASPVH